MTNGRRTSFWSFLVDRVGMLHVLRSLLVFGALYVLVMIATSWFALVDPLDVVTRSLGQLQPAAPSELVLLFSALIGIAAIVSLWVGLALHFGIAVQGATRGTTRDPEREWQPEHEDESQESLWHTARP